MAKLPQSVVEAFGDVRSLREHHARELKPILADLVLRARVLASAEHLAERQKARAAAGEPLMDAPKVLAALKTSARPESSPPQPATTVRNDAGAKLFTLRAKGDRALVELSLLSEASNAEVLAAFERALAQLRPAR